MRVSSNDVRQHLPELDQLKGRRFVVKLGGAAMEDENTKDLICREIAGLVESGISISVVHGGGKEISRWLERLGLTARFINGLRVTDDETMLVTEMVLSGLINNDLVSRFNQLEVRAAGLSGRHGRLLQSRPLPPHQGVDLGRTGEVEQVDLSILTVLLEAGITPIISPVGETLSGRSLNLNADYAAAAIAGALNADACIFLTDVAGVKRGDEVLPRLSLREVHEMIADGSLYGGMIPKVECALSALKAGCKRSVITAAHQRPYALTAALLEREGSGTSFTAESHS